MFEAFIQMQPLYQKPWRHSLLVCTALNRAHKQALTNVKTEKQSHPLLDTLCTIITQSVEYVQGGILYRRILWASLKYVLRL